VRIILSYLAGQALRTNIFYRFRVQGSGYKGDNEKTTIAPLIEKDFRDNTMKMPTSLLRGKEAVSSAAIPELATSKP
jgi:hypothetical protein